MQRARQGQKHETGENSKVRREWKAARREARSEWERDAEEDYRAVKRMHTRKHTKIKMNSHTHTNAVSNHPPLKYVTRSPTAVRNPFTNCTVRIKPCKYLGQPRFRGCCIRKSKLWLGKCSTCPPQLDHAMHTTFRRSNKPIRRRR